MDRDSFNIPEKMRWAIFGDTVLHKSVLVPAKKYKNIFCKKIFLVNIMTNKKNYIYILFNYIMHDKLYIL